MVESQVRTKLGEERPQARAVLAVTQARRLAFFILVDERADTLLVALQEFGTEERVHRQIGQPRQLHAVVLQSVIAEQVQVGEILIDEIPLMLVLVV